MNQAWAKYIAIETAVSVSINAILSLAFTWAFFHGEPFIAQSRLGAMLRDSIPQTFIVALMSFLVPTLLTHKRYRNGVVSFPPGVMPRSTGAVLLRAGAVAALATLMGYLLWRELLHTIFAAGISLSTLLAVKTEYGATLAVILTPLALMAVARIRNR